MKAVRTHAALVQTNNLCCIPGLPSHPNGPGQAVHVCVTTKCVTTVGQGKAKTPTRQKPKPPRTLERPQVGHKCSPGTLLMKECSVTRNG